MGPTAIRPHCSHDELPKRSRDACSRTARGRRRRERDRRGRLHRLDVSLTASSDEVDLAAALQAAMKAIDSETELMILTRVRNGREDDGGDVNAACIRKDEGRPINGLLAC